MVYVRTLGTAQIEAGDLRITPAAGRRFALLLRLAAEPGRRVPRTMLLELVFPGLPESNARHSLRDLVYQFRQAGIMVDANAEGVALATEDVQRDYDDLIRAPRPSVDHLRAAQGGLLPGYAPEHSETFSDWLAAYRARVVLSACRALSVAMDRAKSVGDWLTTEQIARACLGLEPSHEGATIALAETMAVSGSKAEGLKLLDNYIKDLGPRRSQLHAPALAAMRRISEKIPQSYQTELSLPFLGRDSEMLSLNERFEMARAGESQCVVLVGDAGIGKTRLAQEFCTQALLKGAHVEHVATQPHDAHRPMATFADLVPRLLTLPGALGCSPESMSALKRLTVVEPNELPVLTSSETVASTITRAVADLIDAVTNERTLVVLVDDAQWADDISRRTIASLVSARHSRRLLVMLTSRNRSEAQFFAQRAERSLGLSVSALRDSSLAEILARLPDATGRTMDGELRSWIADSSGGNPFFLRCLLAHYQATGERFVVPSTLSTFLDQRLIALNGDAASTLNMCVVLGRHSTLERLIAALELAPLPLENALRELESSNLVRQVEERLEPAHWLVAEATSRMMSPIARRLLHRRAALLLEAEVQRSRLPSQLWDCAEHWIAADDHVRAALAMRECANHSIEIGRPRQASEALLRAAAILGGRESCDLIVNGVRIADEANELDVVLRGSDLAARLGVRIEYDGFELAESLAKVSEWEEHEGAHERLKPWLATNRPEAQRLRAGLAVMIFAEQTGDSSLAHETAQTLFAESADHDTITNLQSLVVRMIYQSSFGDSAVATRLAERLLTMADGLDDVLAADIRRKCAAALLRAGHIETALSVFEQSYEAAMKHGLWRLQFAIAGMLAGLFADALNEELASHWLAEATRLSANVPDYRSSLNYIMLFADLACSGGELAAVQRSLDAVIQQSIVWPSIGATRWTRILAARAAQLAGRPQSVEMVVEGLIGRHRPMTEPGDVSDSETAAAVEVLVAAGQVHRARETLRQYIEIHRRPGAPLNRWLRRLTETLQYSVPAGTEPQRFQAVTRSNMPRAIRAPVASTTTL